MAEPIHIDLRDLTDAHVAEALPTRREFCEYQGPCIIGTLVPVDRRAELDRADLNETTIGELVKAGLVSLPDGQLRLAKQLQKAFDSSDISEESFLKTAARVRSQVSA